ncbi:MAG: hypothetical protein CSYNP_03834 [Syntrophus sp. SKADARSKE-3]|nr:hypothetical protein [Syntrophus sp. SKADARSKE-3]
MSMAVIHHQISAKSSKEKQGIGLPVQQAVEKHTSATLRCKLRQSTYFYVRLIPQLLRALHLCIFEQPARAIFPLFYPADKLLRRVGKILFTFRPIPPSLGQACIKAFGLMVDGGLAGLPIHHVVDASSDDPFGGKFGYLLFGVSHVGQDFSRMFAQVRRVCAPPGAKFGKLHGKSLLGNNAFPGMICLIP